MRTLRRLHSNSCRDLKYRRIDLSLHPSLPTDPMSETPSPSPRALRHRLAETMTSDRARLQAELDRCKPQLPDAAQRLARLTQAIETSVARRARRAASVPVIEIPDELPIAAKAQEIIDAIRAHQVVVIAGATGSGKTTQLPKLCLAAGRGVAGLIGCTQPRRIAAKSIARRVAEELKSPLGALVGFAVRFQDAIGEDALIKFMTDGILLAETQSDRALRRYDTIILDEAHERSLNIDFLLGYAKALLRQRPDLKLIITSATIDTERFATHFGGAPVITVEGRGFPVEVRYRPIAGDTEERGDAGLYRAIGEAVDELGKEDPRGDILVFLPGEREIRDAHKALEQRQSAQTEVLPLYARLSSGAQDRVFQPGNLRRIVLATNVAETSITVPRIRFVIDSGVARINRYSQRAKIQRLQIEPISQASANQRSGRCGRLSAGIAIRLYDEADFLARPEYTDPELLRSSLAGVILRMLDLRIGDPARFPFLDPPSDRALQDGFLLLHELGAVNTRSRHDAPEGEGTRELNEIGRAMARLPIDVRLARFLIAARDGNILDEALVIASGLSVQDPRERPPEVRGLADAAHQIFVHDRSDCLTLVQLWQAYDHEHQERTQSRLREWCRAHFLSYLRMREWRELHRQLLLIARELKWDLRGPSAPKSASQPTASQASKNRSNAGAEAAAARMQESATALSDARAFEALHRAILAAFVTQIARKDEKLRYRGPRSQVLQIFPGSGQAKASPNWIVSGTLLETAKLYALNVARIEQGWIEQAAAHLSKRQFYEPSWDMRGGRAVGFEDLTLYGLPIVLRRKIAYAPVDPTMARYLFLRHQMVRGEGPARHPLLAHNAAVREDARLKEEKLRRRGLLRDEEELAQWFEARVPAEIMDSTALDRWLKRAAPEVRDAVKLSLEDLLIPQARGDEAELFPDAMDLAGARLILSYQFDPRGDRDGVTASVSLADLLALSQADIDWLVPGLREEKAAVLIKSLTKALRRHVVPAPDFARAFLEATKPRAQSFIEALAGFLARVSGVEICASDFDPSTLPAHLLMNLSVIDASGKQLAQGRDLDALKAQFAEAARRAFAARVDAEFHRDQIVGWPLDEIPREVRADGGARAYPALIDHGSHVGLEAFADAARAWRAHPLGVRRLLQLEIDDLLRYWRRQLKLSGDAQMAYGVVDRIEALRADVVDSALDRVAAQKYAETRTRVQFQALVEQARRELGASAQALGDLVDQILKAVKGLRRELAPPLMGFATANLADARAQLEGLVHPGFMRELPFERLAQYPRYLEALRLRLERLKRDPAKDQVRLLEVQPFARAHSELLTRATDDPDVSNLRWLIEEFRVSLFAQELKTPEPVSAKRIAKLVEQLQARWR